MTWKAGFWRGRRVLLTGHTGFKGSWMALWLERAGAHVTGIGLPPQQESLHASLAPWQRLVSHSADIQDAVAVAQICAEANPEVIIHMAAQAILRRSFREPVATFATNVIGTVNLLAAAETQPQLRAILVITSDKVYDNRGTGRCFGEGDRLGGDDPYSASKVAVEAVARCWRESFLGRDHSPALGVARAGNVIGGGDWAEDRIVPDIIRAGRAGLPASLRYPRATRPWQHVLDVTSGYLAYAERLATDPASVPPALNFGPSASDPPVAAAELAAMLQSAFAWDHGWVAAEGVAAPEASRLALDPTLAARTLGWRPKLSIRDAIAWVAHWHRAEFAGADMRQVSLAQLEAFDALPAVPAAVA
jgi:CDP-glucose 4,6-dehydratase